MTKNWWFKFEFNKWRNDSLLRQCSLETKGFWLECICAMREMGTDRLKGSYAEIARMVGCFPDEAERCIGELRRTGTATVTLGNADVTPNVTLVSRYIKKEAKGRELTKLRVRKLRSNADVTVDVTHVKQTPLTSKELISNKKEVREEKKEEETPQAAPPKKGTRVPEPFHLTEEMRQYARLKRPLLDADEETEKFVNYWRAKTGRDATKLDWIATWQNWILNSRATNGTATRKPDPGRQRSEPEAVQVKCNTCFDGGEIWGVGGMIPCPNCTIAEAA